MGRRNRMPLLTAADWAPLLTAAVSWALYLGGLDEVPAWSGFGRGMAVGSSIVLAVRAISRCCLPAAPQTRPKPWS